MINAFSVACIITSCQKVINIDLNSASPQLIVQGNIDNISPSYTVSLSQTVNFNAANSFPPVSGALITITDNLLNTDTLKETIPGTYTGTKLVGTPGRVYTLLVSTGGKQYTSTVSMPTPVNIDTLSMGYKAGKGKAIDIIFRDPAGTANYYHFVELINNVQQSDINVATDYLHDGATQKYSIVNSKDSLVSRDTVLVMLQSVDESVYQYYKTLRDAKGGTIDPINQISPANPRSNISNGALGYFNAFSVAQKTMVVP